MPSDGRISITATSAASIVRALRAHVRPGVLSDVVAGLTGAELETTCRARSQQSGLPCGNVVDPAVLVCHSHGGGAPQVRQAAAGRRAFADAVATGPRREPWEIYLKRLHILDVEADRALDLVLSKGNPTAQDYVNMVEAQQNAMRAAKDAITTGLAERMVQLDERRTAQVYEVLVGALSDLGQRIEDTAVRAAVYGRLRAIEGGEAA